MDAEIEPITEEEKQQIAVRRTMINFHTNSVELLTSEFNMFLRSLYDKRGLNPEKTYRIEDSGAIKEAT